MESHILILNLSSFAYRQVFFVMHPTGRAEKTVKSKGVLCCPQRTDLDGL